MSLRPLAFAVLLLALAFAVTDRLGAAPGSGAGSARMAPALDAYTRPLVDAGHLSGQLLIARHGTIVLERSYGYANDELRVPITAETRLNIASVTKPMTTVLAIQLMVERKVAMRDSLARWIPDFPRGDSIRIEHLLRHRSGIPHRVTTRADEVHPMTAAEVAAAAARATLDFAPGSRSSYSSGGFSVLARVLELASGMSYAALLLERLCKPLGMTHTLHADARALLAGRATGYVAGAHGMERAPLQDLSFLVGAGSVWSTARDIHLFVQALVTGKLGPGPQQSFVRGGKLDFNGVTDGFRAFADWDSASGLEVVFLGNTHTGAADLLRAAIPRLAAGETLAAPRLPVLRTTAVAADSLLRLEGVFEMTGGPRLKLRVWEGTLYSSGWALLPMPDGAFFSPRDYGIVRPVFGADGRVTRLDWTQSGTIYPFPRVGDLSPGTRWDDED